MKGENLGNVLQWKCFWSEREMCLKSIFGFYFLWLNQFAEEHDVPNKTINSFHQIDIESGDGGGSDIDDIRERIRPFCFVSGVDVLVHFIYFLTMSHRRSCNWRVWHMWVQSLTFMCLSISITESQQPNVTSARRSKQTAREADGWGGAYDAIQSIGSEGKKLLLQLTECIVNRDGEVWPKFRTIFIMRNTHRRTERHPLCYHHCFLSTSFQLFTC